MPTDKVIRDDYRYIKSILIPFIRENGDRRVSKATTDHYKLFTIQRNLMDEVIISEVCEDNKVLAVSVATIRNGSHVTFSTTVTHKECRGKGHGTQALQAKLAALKDRGMGLKTVIAEDNKGAMKICEKAGLRIIETQPRTRSTGPYNAVIWIDSWKLTKDEEVEE